jgi:glycosyltransferase involved in cell wall biosynthesis
MNAAGQTICLCMIVKNESRVVARCLASVRPLIDAWAIVDTGSTDGTQDVVRAALRDLPGELIERPWVDFGHNRSEALRLARGRGDYVLVIDADETLAFDDGFALPELTADAYTAEVFYSGCTYLRRQLVKNALPWRYEGVLHEYITCEQALSEGFIDGMRTVVSTDGARSSDPHKFRRDALVLERALLDDPQNSRYAFYLAQSYRDAGDVELALRWYRKRVEMGGWPQEVWFSLYQIAALEHRAQEPWPTVFESYQRAYQADPSRAEPLFRIALTYQARREYHTAMLFLRRAAALPVPPASALFVERPLYDVQLPLEHAVAAHYAGDYETAVAVNNRLLRSSALPPAMIEHVISNRRFSLDARAPKPADRAQAVPVHAIVVYRDPGPELDDLVESLLRSDAADLRVTFVDDGSQADHAARLPLDDPRCALVRCAAPLGFERAVREHLPAHDAVVVALTPADRIADAKALATVTETFADPGCMLAYGQFRRADGALGDAEPAESAAAFAARGPACASRAPLFCRSALVHAAHAGAPLPQALWDAAGFAGTRFSDAVLTIAAHENSAAPARAPAGAPPQISPMISCLMVTYDRLVLAKRAFRSFARQTWPNRELVVVTAGSERFRRALADDAAAAGIAGAVRFVVAGADSTLGALRNLALDAARGGIVCQWDDDDYSHPERLQTQASYLLAHGADACCLTDHLQYIEDRHTAFWVDWTDGGRLSGTASYLPGTLMMRAERRVRYPESGQYANAGEDSVFLDRLAAAGAVVGLSGNAHLYLYHYHGRNTFPERHHHHIATFGVGKDVLNRNEARIREALLYAEVARPAVVAGRDGPAFVVA